MRNLDAHFAAQTVPIHARQLLGEWAVSNRLGFSGTPLFAPRQDRGAPWSPSDILGRVSDWFETIYGQRLAIDASPGSTVVELRGAFWEVRTPRLYGSMIIFLDKNLGNQGVQGGRSHYPTANVLGYVEGLGPQLAAELSDAELALIADNFLQGFKATRTLDRLSGNVLFDQAKAHYRHSISEIVRNGGLPGNAHRETSLCCEKVVKGILSVLGKPYPKGGSKGHDLAHLFGLLGSDLREPSSSGDLASIQCDAGAAYEHPSTWSEAIGAHKALRRVLYLLDPGGMPCELLISGTVATRTRIGWSMPEHLAKKTFGQKKA